MAGRSLRRRGPSALLRGVDDRLHASHFARETLNKVFPDHWSFMIGEVALYALVVLIATGVYLTLFFEPSSREVVYTGSYLPLQGETMSAAYQSTIQLSFDVRAGLVMRQVHHWAALVFAGAIVVHMARIFFTGGFRRPRELNWVIGVTLLALALANGFTGYSLPDDLLSGTGLRIAWSNIMAIPVVGSWFAVLAFGGEYPGEAIISRLFVLHILIVPAAIVGLLGAHLAILWRQKHTQFPGRGRTDRNVVGSRLWPTYALRSLGVFAAVVAVLAGLGGLAQINPVWLYGPYEPASVSTAAQPDWYLGWTEGGFRLLPPFKLTLLGYRVPPLAVSGVLLPAVTFVLLYAWPFLEARVTGDHREHHLLDRPRDRPARTAIGTGAFSFYVILFIGGGQDVFAENLHVEVGTIRLVLQWAALLVPPLVALGTAKACRDLAAADPLAAAARRGDVPEPAGMAD